MLHCLEHLYADSGFHLFFWYCVSFAYNTWRETITALGGFRLLDSIDFATLQQPVAEFRLHLANPPLRLPSYPSPASFRTSPLASSLIFTRLRLDPYYYPSRVIDFQSVIPQQGAGHQAMLGSSASDAGGVYWTTLCAAGAMQIW